MMSIPLKSLSWTLQPRKPRIRPTRSQKRRKRYVFKKRMFSHTLSRKSIISKNWWKRFRMNRILKKLNPKKETQSRLPRFSVCSRTNSTLFKCLKSCPPGNLVKAHRDQVLLETCLMSCQRLTMSCKHHLNSHKKDVGPKTGGSNGGRHYRTQENRRRCTCSRETNFDRFMETLHPFTPPSRERMLPFQTKMSKERSTCPIFMNNSRVFGRGSSTLDLF